MKERHRRRQTDIALEGGWGGGSRPFGLKPVHKPDAKGASRTGHVLVINEDEAKLLREAAKGLLSGLSAESIAAQWSADGVQTAAGKRWTGSGLRRTITSPAVAGLRVHHGEIVADATWEPVLDRDTWERVRVNLAARPKARRGRPVREYLLTSRCVCGGVD